MRTSSRDLADHGWQCRPKPQIGEATSARPRKMGCRTWRGLGYRWLQYKLVFLCRLIDGFMKIKDENPHIHQLFPYFRSPRPFR